MTDPLAGTDTYDILGGLKPAELPDLLERWGRMEQHELMQMPNWASMVGMLLREAGKEITYLRRVAGAVETRPDFAEIKRSSRSEVKAALVDVVKSTTVESSGC